MVILRDPRAIRRLLIEFDTVDKPHVRQRARVWAEAILATGDIGSEILERLKRIEERLQQHRLAQGEDLSTGEARVACEPGEAPGVGRSG